MNEEAKKVLQMIADGKITAQEGQKLLDVILGIGQDNETVKKDASPIKKNRILRIKIDARGKSKKDNARVTVNIPLEIAKKVASLTALIPKEAKKEMRESGIDLDAINLEELIGMFEEGLMDENLVDIESGDAEKGATVKIYVD